MALNKFYIKKWIKMISGKSILHVNQCSGKHYDKYHINGYYNDLTEKVTKSNIDINDLPKTLLPNGKTIDFSIAIFQYGLGAYDIYIETRKKEYLKRFYNAVEWAVKNQQKNGSWNTFEYENTVNPYSSMAQGEGASLLLRAFVESKNIKYKKCAYNAIKFMMKDVKNNGCTSYNDGDVILKEFPNKPAVLNGWIFSLFGLYDLLLIENNQEIKKFYNNSIITLTKMLPKYDLKYWSKYDLGKKIASPFYHRLHVELLKVLYDLNGNEAFIEYAKKFDKYQKNILYKFVAFAKKAYQKIIEK